MFNQNIITVSGRLGGDAEVKTLPRGGKCATFSVAVDHNFKNRAGKWETVTSWVRVVTYMPWVIDNIIIPECKKGRLLFVQGVLRARTWDDNGKKKSIIEIDVDNAGGITPVTGDSQPINQVLLVGRLGSHADIKTLPNQEGGKVASFSLANDRSFKDSAGQWQNKTEWFRVVTFQSTLIDRVLAKTATKGRLVMVQGFLRTREWADSNGEIQTSTEIEVDTTGSILPVLEEKPNK